MRKDDEKNLLGVKGLRKRFPVRGGLFSKTKGFVHAVNDVSFFIDRSETLGLVGESGCGKTTVGRCILRLIEPDSGEVVFEGKNLLSFNRNDLRRLRKDIQIVFQNPFASLDPRMTVHDLIAEPMKVHKLFPSSEIDKRVFELLMHMNLDTENAYRYPHEFSGGQRQRIAIARALSLNPKFIVLDEPTSALDISVQAQILRLLRKLQQELGLTYLFISHNLAVIRTMSNRVAVMYLGKIVELAICEDIFASPMHPYTEALLAAELDPDPLLQRNRLILKGDVPSPIELPRGCAFHARCSQASEICREKTPEYVEVKDGHFVSCHLRTIRT